MFSQLRYQLSIANFTPSIIQTPDTSVETQDTGQGTGRIDIYDDVEIKSVSYVDMMDGLPAGFCPWFL